MQQQINQIRRFFSTTQTPDSVITQYYSDLRHNMTAEELAEVRQLFSKYYEKYGQIGLMEDRMKKIRKQLFSCTGSRVGNSCTQIPGALKAKTVCLDIEKCLRKPPFILYLEAKRSLRDLRLNIDQNVETYGQIILGELAAIEDEKDRAKEEKEDEIENKSPDKSEDKR